MSEEFEKKLMRLKKDDLKDQARIRQLSENGTKADLVSFQLEFSSNWNGHCLTTAVALAI